MKKSILVAFVSISLFYSCSSDDSDSTTDPDTNTENTIKLANDATLGNILTDADGMSLYFFSRDSKLTSECNSSDCLAAWPIFYTATLNLDTGLEASDFAQITRADGQKQTTYKGWPLYYFFNDTAAGDTNGDKVGNNWYIAKPDYSLMYVEAQLVGKDADGNNINFTSDYTPGDERTFYITNSKGRTLYTFKNDTKDNNNYTLEDFSNNSTWPVYHIDLDKIPSILDKNDFNTIEVFGTKQLTYKGWPLYYFGGDTERGDNFGINVPSPGVWPIANVDTAPAN